MCEYIYKMRGGGNVILDMCFQTYRENLNLRKPTQTKIRLVLYDYVRSFTKQIQ